MNELKASSRQVADACTTANGGVQEAQTIATGGTRSVDARRNKNRAGQF
ncbi:hypothetical protein [Oscillatoria acuminata]|nr:hypothetical protein [Oscillatoria acuminata]